MDYNPGIQIANPYTRFENISFCSDLHKTIQKKGALVFGTGVMGTGIVSTFLKAGIPVSMQDISKKILDETEKKVLEILQKGLKKRKLSKEQNQIIKEKGLLKEKFVFDNNNSIPFQKIDEKYKESKDTAKDYISQFLDKNLGTNSTARKNYDVAFFLDSGPEVPPFKQNVARFAKLSMTSQDAIFATNTSSLKIDDIADKLENKEQIIGFHYFFPSHINPLLEIILGSKTSDKTLYEALCIGTAMGKKTIICFKDSPGGIPNRILVGVLNEAAKIYDDGLGTVEEIDKIFLETFYSKQIKIKTKKAKRQFNAAPKLGFFKDEVESYKSINETKEPLKKRRLLEKTLGNLRQKVLYASIVGNLEELGAFFKPALCVSKLMLEAKEQAKRIDAYLKEVENNPDKLKEKFDIKPYNFPKPEKPTSYNPELIKARLIAAYIAISLKILKENLGTIQDIELACKEGFKWNIGPFEMMADLPEEKTKELINLANSRLNQSENTGIANINDLIEITENDISGTQTYIQGDLGFIVLGRIHIQQLKQTQNSLSPQMLHAISKAIETFEANSKIKSIIIKSQGGGPFSSGADLNYIESTNWDIEKITSFIDIGKKTMDQIASCSKPTIAIVDGAAVGGGLELALACDYRIMTDYGFAAMPEVALGIIPYWGGTERLPRIIGKKLAKRMICNSTLKNLGLKLSGKDAFEVGLADAYILQSELPFYLTDLVNGKIKYKEVYLNEPPIINIYKKPSKKANYDKTDYPENLVKRFKLNKSFKHNFRIFTKFAADLAFKLIENSHNPSYSQEINNNNTSRLLLKNGKNVFNWQIKPLILAAQHDFWGPLLERIGIL